MSGVDMLEAGKIDIAVLDSTQATIALSPPRTLSAEVISLQYQDGESSGLLVRSTIRSPSDLRGKTLATPRGSTSHYQLSYLLDLTSLTDDVNIILAPPSQYAELWRRGEIDGVCYLGSIPDGSEKCI